MLKGQRGAGTGQQGTGEIYTKICFFYIYIKKKIRGKREAYSASQKQFGISKLNKSEASVRMLHCNTVALNPLLSL